MIYSDKNVKTSALMGLTTYFRALGYNIFWHSKQVSQAHTAAQEKDTITVVEYIPAVPANLVILNDGSTASKDEVALPALTMRVFPRVLDKIVGLGHSDYFWTRILTVEGFAKDSIQHGALTDELDEWLRGGINNLPVWDYESNPASPPTLDDADVVLAVASKDELAEEKEARYYFQLTVRIRYVE